MRVLLLVQKDQRVILDRLYDSIAQHVGRCEIRWLTRNEQTDLRAYFASVDIYAYDRIVFFLRFKQEIRQVGFIRSIPNLVILEHDAYQNYLPGKYHDKFSQHYSQLPWARIISSGFSVTQNLRREGFDAEFVSKGFDQQLLRNLHKPRSIELGFVGSIESKIYAERKKLLTRLAQHEKLLIVRTRSGDEYLQKLNEIRFFVSADVGMGEYMIKNFEAMACGCVLIACNQGEAENVALGFVDMHNVVLYRDYDELIHKLAQLRQDVALADRIAANGEALAQQHFQFFTVGRQIAQQIVKPMRVAVARTLAARVFGRFDAYEEPRAQPPRIAIVIPYFGQWPFWIDLFWASCRRNAHIDWLIYSDCPPPAQLSANVHFSAISFTDYKARVSQALGIAFNPTRAYKLCDLKPMYGFIHQQELKDYDYFGFGDVDVVYGDLHTLLTEAVLAHNVISTHDRRISGHFCVLKNTAQNREAFRKVKEWSSVLEDADNFRFDEKHFSKIFLPHKNWSKLLQRIAALFDPFQQNNLFREVYSTPNARVPWHDGKHGFPTHWYWRAGRLTNNLGGERDYPYLHFLSWKRNWPQSRGAAALDHSMLESGVCICEQGIGPIDNDLTR